MLSKKKLRCTLKNCVIINLKKTLESVVLKDDTYDSNSITFTAKMEVLRIGIDDQMKVRGEGFKKLKEGNKVIVKITKGF